jgi:hypothetical protein
VGWARFDDGYSDHPKILAAGPMAELLDMRAIIWCARLETDGAVPREALHRIGHDLPQPTKLAARLVRVGRWEKRDDGWEIVDFLDYNPSRSDLEKRRAGARDRMRRARSAKGDVEDGLDDGSDDVRANGSRTLRDVRVTPSRPDPLLVTSRRDGSTSEADGCGQTEEPSTTGAASRSRETTADQVLERMAEARLATTPNVRNRQSYKRAILRNLRDEYGQKLEALLDDFPGAPPECFAGALLGEPNRLADYRRREP